MSSAKVEESMDFSLEEVLDTRQYTPSELFLNVYVMQIDDTKVASEILSFLSDFIPLDTFGLNHLKRLRRLQTSADSSVLEAIICPERDFEAVRISLQDKGKIFRVVQIPKLQPLERCEFEEWGKLWPLKFRPHESARERERGHSIDELNRCKAYMAQVSFDSDECSKLIGRYRPGAILVSDEHKQIVVSSCAVLKYLKEVHGSLIDRHPLYTPTTLCIEGISATIRGDFGSRDILSADHYLCTGLDLYLEEEPDLMSSMALVHSRIRRVFFRNPAPSDGALFSHYKLHALRALNHKFRVFRVLDDGVRTPLGRLGALESKAVEKPSSVFEVFSESSLRKQCDARLKTAEEERRVRVEPDELRREEIVGTFCALTTNNYCNNP